MTHNTDNPDLVVLTPPADPDEWITVRQVAELLGLNERYVRNELISGASPESIKAGQHIETIRLGKGGPKSRYRSKPRWVQEFTDRRRASKGSAPTRATSAA